MFAIVDHQKTRTTAEHGRTGAQNIPADHVDIQRSRECVRNCRGIGERRQHQHRCIGRIVRHLECNSGLAHATRSRECDQTFRCHESAHRRDLVCAPDQPRCR